MMRIAPGLLQRSALWLAAPLLTACGGSLLQSDLPATAIYVMAPAPRAPASVPMLPIDLSIGRPHVSPGLDTDRIAALEGRRLDYFSAARWGGTAREVVQTFLVASLEDHQVFRSVTAEEARVAGDYVLDVQLRDFQAEYAGAGAAPAVRVRMIGHLIRIQDRKLVATLAAQALQSAEDNRMHAVAAAFEAAAQAVALDLGQQTYAAVNADLAALP